jgi:hypothetical protein
VEGLDERKSWRGPLLVLVVLTLLLTHVHACAGLVLLARPDVLLDGLRVGVLDLLLGLGLDDLREFGARSAVARPL